MIHSTEPLRGCSVVVCRPELQAGSLTDRLQHLGADVIALPLFKIVGPPDGGSALDEALGRIEQFDWLVVTSANGARAVAQAEAFDSLDVVRLAAVGPASKRSLQSLSSSEIFLPATATASALAKELPAKAGERVLVPLAANASTVVADTLSSRGVVVETPIAYDQQPIEPDPKDLRRSMTADAVVVTSPSSMEALVRLWSGPVPPLISIGPSTSKAIAVAGYAVAAEAVPHSLDGLIQAAVNTLKP